MISSGWLSLAASFGLTLGLLLGVLLLIKRLQNRATGPVESIPLRVLKRIPVGPKQSVAILQVGDRSLVVSISDHGTRLLTELDDVVEDPVPGVSADLPVPL
ncbi:MAG: hypothetical protein GF346_07450, partial [Candidatus Eisenbacteria bacterium]|nr:hypothetical protein [Candidatus Latescibacterota bacterium]MBD3302267.1 hypothetical protein [Candidatus Eisenbacteria bacterium]